MSRRKALNTDAAARRAREYSDAIDKRRGLRAGLSEAIRDHRLADERGDDAGSLAIARDIVRRSRELLANVEDHGV